MDPMTGNHLGSAAGAVYWAVRTQISVPIVYEPEICGSPTRGRAPRDIIETRADETRRNRWTHPAFQSESAKPLRISRSSATCHRRLGRIPGLQPVRGAENASFTEGGALALAPIAVLLVVLPAESTRVRQAVVRPRAKLTPASNYDAFAADLAISC
jgi:hypothetical protein